MKHYINIFLLSLVVIAFVYDYFTRKLSGGKDPASRFFRTSIYLIAVFAMLMAIMNRLDKLEQ